MWWIKYVIGAVLAGSLVGGIYYYGYDAGQNSMRETVNRKVNTVLSGAEERLDKQEALYEEAIKDLLNRLHSSEQSRREEEERQVELQREIGTLRTTLSNLQGQIYESDIGTCDLTSEFDRLFLRAEARSQQTGQGSS